MSSVVGPCLLQNALHAVLTPLCHPNLTGDALPRHVKISTANRHLLHCCAAIYGQTDTLGLSVSELGQYDTLLQPPSSVMWSVTLACGRKPGCTVACCAMRLVGEYG